MNESGFNLFTALVAIILIVLAALLWNTMTDSERSITDIITDIEEEQKMQNIADLSKADALHAFNFGIRLRIETHLTRDGVVGSTIDPPDGIPDNDYLISKEIAESGWGEIKKDFARTFFGACETTADGRTCNGRQFATITANYLTGLLERTPDARGYSISIDKPNATDLQQLLQKVFDKSSEEDGFFEVINCNGKWDDCSNGTFYVNLNLKSPENGGYLEDEEYEKFPKIVVENKSTGRVLKEPVLPRGNVQIYIPLRLFKAISGGLEIARGDPKGIFEEEFTAQMNSLKIGICDPGCIPTSPSGYFTDSPNYACAGDNVSGNNLPIIPFGGTYSYNPNDSFSMNTNLGLYATNEFLHPQINKMALEHVPDEATFKIIKRNDNYASSARAIVLGEPSRIIETVLQIDSGTVRNAFCSKVSRIEAIVVFEDSDEKYIVSNVSASGTNRYAIRFMDTSYPEYDPQTTGSLPVCKTTKGGIDVTSITCVQG